MSAEPEHDTVYVTCRGFPWCDRAEVHPPHGTPETKTDRGTYAWAYGVDGIDGWICPGCRAQIEAQNELVPLRSAHEDLEEMRKALHGANEWLTKVLSDAVALHHGKRPNEIDDPRISFFAHLMCRELAANEFKGDWKDSPPLELASELLYHAFKLVLAVEHGDHGHALEFAADCGNLAMMTAEMAGALTPKHLPSDVPEDRTWERQYTPLSEPLRAQVDHARLMVADVFRELLGATDREMQLRKLLEQHPAGQIGVPF